MGKHQHQLGGRRGTSEATARVKASIRVCKGKARQGRVDSLGLASATHVDELLVIGVVSSCLLPGPRMITVEHCLLGYKG